MRKFTLPIFILLCLLSNNASATPRPGFFVEAGMGKTSWRNVSGVDIISEIGNDPTTTNEFGIGYQFGNFFALSLSRQNYLGTSFHSTFTNFHFRLYDQDNFNFTILFAIGPLNIENNSGFFDESYGELQFLDVKSAFIIAYKATSNISAQLKIKHSIFGIVTERDADSSGTFAKSSSIILGVKYSF